MIGFITTPETSYAVTKAIAMAQTSRGLPVTWVLEGIPILSGEHKGFHFIQADDDVLNNPIRESFTAKDFPEFAELIQFLGGMDARVDIDPSFFLSLLTKNQ